MNAFRFNFKSPQLHRFILLPAHENIKLFITHGGLLSTIETVHYGVPIVGIPIMADQKMNMENAISNGYGVGLKFNELSEETFEAAINEILQNPK